MFHVGHFDGLADNAVGEQCIEHGFGEVVACGQIFEHKTHVRHDAKGFFAVADEVQDLMVQWGQGDVLDAGAVFGELGGSVVLIREVAIGINIDLSARGQGQFNDLVRQGAHGLSLIRVLGCGLG